MKKLLTITALFALAVPVAFAAPPDPTPAQLCKQQRQSMSAADFASLYAPGKPKSALGKCISNQSQLIATSTANAAKQCKAERGTTAQSVQAFKDAHGTNKNKANAMGNCVSGKAKEAVTAQQQQTLNAAKQCKAERGTTAQSVQAFKDAHGTNKNKSNAFGKCVSKTVKSGS